MAVMLIIRNVIGIILLALFLLILAVVLTILFWPIRYRIHAKVESISEWTGEFRVSWLFRGLQLRGRKDADGTKVWSQILWIKKPMYDMEEEKETKCEDSKICEEIQSEPDIVEKKESRKEKVPSSIQKEAVKEPDQTVQKAKKDHATEQETSFEEEWKEEWEETWDHEVEKESKRSKWKEIAGRVREFWKWFKEDETKKMRKEVWEQAKILIHCFLPKKLRGEISYGTPDPAWTGKIIGALSLCPWVCTDEFRLYPDFTKESWEIEGYLDAKGHIRLVSLLKTLIWYWRNEKLQNTMKKWKHEN